MKVNKRSLNILLASTLLLGQVQPAQAINLKALISRPWASRIPIKWGQVDNSFQLATEEMASPLMPVSTLEKMGLNVSARIAKLGGFTTPGLQEVTRKITNRLASKDPFVFIQLESGEGRTTHIENLAHRLISKKDHLSLPSTLRERRILQLSIEKAHKDGKINEEYFKDLLAQLNKAKKNGSKLPILVIDGVEKWLPNIQDADTPTKEYLKTFVKKIEELQAAGASIVITGNSYSKNYLLGEGTGFLTRFLDVQGYKMTSTDAAAFLINKKSLFTNPLDSRISNETIELAVRIAEGSLAHLGVPSGPLRLLQNLETLSLSLFESQLSRTFATIDKRKTELSNALTLLGDNKGVMTLSSRKIIRDELAELIEIEKAATAVKNAIPEKLQKIERLSNRIQELNSALRNSTRNSTRGMQLEAELTSVTKESQKLVKEITDSFPQLRVDLTEQANLMIEAVEMTSRKIMSNIEKEAFVSKYGFSAKPKDFAEEVSKKIVGNTDQIINITKGLWEKIYRNAGAGKGLIVLDGDPGTGKTFSSEIISDLLGRKNHLIEVPKMQGEIAITSFTGATHPYVGAGELTKIQKAIKEGQTLIFDELSRGKDEFYEQLLKLTDTNNPGIMTHQFGFISAADSIKLATQNVMYPTSPYFRELVHSQEWTEAQLLQYFEKLYAASSTDQTKMAKEMYAKFNLLPDALISRIQKVVIFRQFDPKDVSDLVGLQYIQKQEKLAGKSNGIKMSQMVRGMISQYVYGVGARDGRKGLQEIDNVFGSVVDELTELKMARGSSSAPVVEKGDLVFLNANLVEEPGNKSTWENAVSRMESVMSVAKGASDTIANMRYTVLKQINGRYYLQGFIRYDSGASIKPKAGVMIRVDEKKNWYTFKDAKGSPRMDDVTDLVKKYRVGDGLDLEKLIIAIEDKMGVKRAP